MPVPQAHAGRPRRLILSVLVLLLLPGAAVVWLGVQLLSQDRELEARQRDERRESTADVLAAALEQSVATSERRLRAGDMTWAAAYRDTVALTLRASGVDAYPRGRLLFQPRLPAGDAGHEDPGAFANGEALEYRDRNLSAAAAAFRAAAVSFDPHVRAGALLREARVLRKMGRPDAALTAYREMAQVRAARAARCCTISAAIASATAKRADFWRTSWVARGRSTAARSRPTSRKPSDGLVRLPPCLHGKRRSGPRRNGWRRTRIATPGGRS